MKVHALSARAVAAARRTLRAADVRGPRDINVEVIAAEEGVLVLYGPLTTAHAHIVRAGRRAIVRVDERSKGAPRARFTVAHELGHHLLHEDDHFLQCIDTGPRGGRAWMVEREANDFAAELLIPEALGAPYCAAPLPRIDAVERLARLFKTSFEMSAIRFVELTPSPCAAVMIVDGTVRWASESRAFPGKIVKGRRLHPASDAQRAADRPTTVPGAVWGGTEPFVEHAVPLESGGSMCWVVSESA